MGELQEITKERTTNLLADRPQLSQEVRIMCRTELGAEWSNDV